MGSAQPMEGDGVAGTFPSHRMGGDRPEGAGGPTPPPHPAERKTPRGWGRCRVAQQTTDRQTKPTMQTGWDGERSKPIRLDSLISQQLFCSRGGGGNSRSQPTVDPDPDPLPTIARRVPGAPVTLVDLPGTDWRATFATVTPEALAPNRAPRVLGGGGDQSLWVQRSVVL